MSGVLFGTDVLGMELNSVGVVAVILIGALIVAWVIWELWQMTRKNRQAGVVDQRLEAWFRPFGEVVGTGHLDGGERPG